MTQKQNPTFKQTATAYFFVAMAIAILLYGIYILFSSSVDEKIKDYDKRKQFREQSDRNRTRMNLRPIQQLVTYSVKSSQG